MTLPAPKGAPHALARRAGERAADSVLVSRVSTYGLTTIVSVLNFKSLDLDLSLDYQPIDHVVLQTTKFL